MKLVDILPLDQWVELERQINERFGLNAAVFDKEGSKVTDYRNWANRLCPLVKANEKGQSFICALANQNMMTQAIQTRRPVAGECDAGLVKILVPIFMGDEFLGAAGGCGLLLDDSEVDCFLVSKVTGIDEGEIKGLADDIHAITADKRELLIEFLEEQIEGIVRGYKEQI